MYQPDPDGRSAPAFVQSAPQITAHPLRFTGSGGEYFRVWIINVLLSIVTLGLYTPWARRRTAQYFYGHTLVAGSPLEFTATQSKMVKGFVLMALLTLAYQIAVYSEQRTALSLFMLGGTLLSPLIWGSAMRFRLGATRWRGLRLQFAAGWGDIYKANWPVFFIGLISFLGVWGCLTLFVEALPSEPPLLITPPVAGLAALSVALIVACYSRLEYNCQSLVVRRSQVGVESGRWKPLYADFAKIWLTTAVFFIACVFVCAAAAITLVVALVYGISLARYGSLHKALPWPQMLLLAGILLGIMLPFLIASPTRAFRQARMFHLMWSNIGVSQVARFKCTLPTRSYVLLRMKNLLLTVLTLGFYRPFARVSEYRMKVDSVTLHIKGSVDQLAGQLARQQQSGLGDALADAAGLDLIG